MDQLREAEQTAPAWLLHRAETIVPIPGTTSVAHLRENMQVLEVSLSTEQFERLAALEDPGAG